MIDMKKLKTFKNIAFSALYFSEGIETISKVEAEDSAKQKGQKTARAIQHFALAADRALSLIKD